MNTALVAKQVESMGARIRFGAPRNGRRELDVRNDARGEYFLLNVPADVPVEVVDVRPEIRHALLLIRDAGEKQKYLLGHDERHWFVAAVPGRSVCSVATAMAALRPEEAQSRHGRVRRQGEWFFVPRPGLEPDPHVIFRNEPLSRGRGSKPHVCEDLYRTGGVTVCVCSRHPTGVSEAEMNAIVAANPRARAWGWRRMTRDARVFVRGKVRHADHATIRLDDWHQVYLNNERFASWAERIAFLD